MGDIVGYSQQGGEAKAKVYVSHFLLNGGGWSVNSSLEESFDH